MTKHTWQQVKKIGWPLLIVGVIGVGLAVRILKAWAMRYSANGDFGIVALMARHMAHGIDFPVFFYGQPYMGGLEPMVSGLMSFLLKGDSTAFPINLGTALVGASLLPVVYVFARDAGSRRAGLIALIYCVVGSDTLLHYSVAPRGGYMIMMVGGLLALWLTCRVVTLENQGGQASKGAFWAIGLAAGIAWWATQLVTVFLLVAGLIVFAGWRWRLIRRSVMPVTLGFFIGGLPWWWWNATHQWASFDFGSSFGKVRFREGFESFRNLFLSVVEMSPETWVGMARLAMLGALAAGFLWILVRDKLRGGEKKTFYFRLAVPLLIVAMALLYSTSQYVRAHASRYLLPLVPALAVMIGVGCDRLLQRFRFPWGWIVAVLVLPSQILLMTRMFDGVPADRTRWALAERLETEVAPACEGVFLADYYAYHWLNYVSQEKLCVAELPMERYVPYARRAEVAERPAYLDNYFNIKGFLAATRSPHQAVDVNGLSVVYGAVPPPDDWQYMAASNIVAIRDGDGTNLCAGIPGATHSESWSGAVRSQSKRSRDFFLASPVSLVGIRLLSFSGRYPGLISVEGRRDARAPWVSLLPPTSTTRYFWSGPYVVLEGIQYFQEFRMNAPTGGVSEVRLTFHNVGKNEEPVGLNEILFLEQAPCPVGNRPPVARCVEYLRGRKVRQVYAPRWLADRIAIMVPPGEMSVRAPSLIGRRLNELPQQDSTNPQLLVFRETTGLFMDERDAPRSRNALRAAGLNWAESRIGSLILLVVPAPETTPVPKPKTHLFWTEQGCFSVPGNELKRVPPSAVPAGIRFENRLELAGMSFGGDGSRITVKSGTGLSMSYFWKCPLEVNLTKWVAFVHFKNAAGKVIFQDDHMLFDNLPPDDLLHQEPREIFSETRQVAVPGTVPPGDYQVWVGMVERRSGQRIKGVTNLKIVKRAVEIPVVVTVEP
jgi:hypothetical protein